MEVPKKITVDMMYRHQPADYSTEDEDDDLDYDPDVYTPPRIKTEPITRLMTPPSILTVDHIEEDRRRNLRNNNGMNDSMYRTPNENKNSFQSEDPISYARKYREILKRVELLEGRVNRLEDQNNRQILVLGVISAYILSRGVKWMLS